MNVEPASRCPGQLDPSPFRTGSLSLLTQILCASLTAWPLRNTPCHNLAPVTVTVVLAGACVAPG
jgi:hypothetical protein